MRQWRGTRTDSTTGAVEVWIDGRWLPLLPLYDGNYHMAPLNWGVQSPGTQSLACSILWTASEEPTVELIELLAWLFARDVASKLPFDHFHLTDRHLAAWTQMITGEMYRLELACRRRLCDQADDCEDQPSTN